MHCRLFRRGSRNSLSLPSEENPVQPGGASEEKTAPRQLEELFGGYSDSTGDGQTTPPLPSTSRRDKNPRELDEFLDLLSEVGQDRIDDQRSPPVEDKAFNKLRMVQSKRPPIPSYFLPTGSPKKDRPKRQSADKSAKKSPSSSNCKSLPDLLADDPDPRPRVNTYTTGCQPQAVGGGGGGGGATEPHISRMPLKGSSSVDVLGSNGGASRGKPEEERHQRRWWPGKQRVSISNDAPLEGTASEPTKRRFKFRRSKNKQQKHQPVQSTKSTPGAVPKRTSTSPLAEVSYTKTATSPLGSAYAVTAHSEDVMYPYSEDSTQSSTQLDQEVYPYSRPCNSKGRAKSASDILDFEEGEENGDQFALYQTISEGELLQSEIMDGLFDGIDLDDEVEEEEHPDDEFGDDPATIIELERIELNAVESYSPLVDSPPTYTAVRRHNPSTGEGMAAPPLQHQQHTSSATAAGAAKYPSLERGLLPKLTLQEKVGGGEYSRNRYNSLDSAFRLNNNTNNGAVRNTQGNRRISDGNTSTWSANLFFSASLGFTDSAIMKSSSNSSSPIGSGSRELLPCHPRHPSIDEVAQEM